MKEKLKRIPIWLICIGLTEYLGLANVYFGLNRGSIWAIICGSMSIALCVTCFVLMIMDLLDAKSEVTDTNTQKDNKVIKISDNEYYVILDE